MNNYKQNLINDYFKNESVKEGVDQLLIKYLTPNEIKVIKIRFGLDNGNVKTLEEASSILGLTREKIRQIEAKALRKLRLPRKNSEYQKYFYYY